MASRRVRGRAGVGGNVRASRSRRRTDPCTTQRGAGPPRGPPESSGGWRHYAPPRAGGQDRKCAGARLVWVTLHHGGICPGRTKGVRWERDGHPSETEAVPGGRTYGPSSVSRPADDFCLDRMTIQSREAESQGRGPWCDGPGLACADPLRARRGPRNSARRTGDTPAQAPPRKKKCFSLVTIDREAAFASLEGGLTVLAGVRLPGHVGPPVGRR
jgi:hypothetical protein